VDVPFRNYLIGRVSIALALVGHNFITALALERFNLSGAEVGGFTAALLAAQAISDPILGGMADRWGHKQVLELATAVGLAAILMALVAPAPVWFLVIFVLVGFFAGGVYPLRVYTGLQFCSFRSTTRLHRRVEHCDGADRRRWTADLRVARRNRRVRDVVRRSVVDRHRRAGVDAPARAAPDRDDIAGGGAGGVRSGVLMRLCPLIPPAPFSHKRLKGEDRGAAPLRPYRQRGLNFPPTHHFHPISAIFEPQPFAGLRVVDPDEQMVRRLAARRAGAAPLPDGDGFRQVCHAAAGSGARGPSCCAMIRLCESSR
jgi:hypothetical protein